MKLQYMCMYDDNELFIHLILLYFLDDIIDDDDCVINDVEVHDDEHQMFVYDEILYIIEE